MAIQDPHEMDMEKRLLVAMVLSMAVLFLASYFYQPPTPLPPSEEASVAAEPAGEPSQVEPLPTTATAETPATTAERRTIEVENAQLILRWSTAGGILESVQLKDYISTEGAPLEIIPRGLAAGQNQTLGVRVGDDDLDRRLAAAVYEIEGATLGRRRAPTEITFVYRDDQLEVRRTVRIPETGYLLEMATEVRSGNRSLPFSVSSGSRDWRVCRLIRRETSEPPRWPTTSTAPWSGITAADVEEEPGRLGPGARWLAMDSKYFALVVLYPEGIEGGQIRQNEFSETTPDGEPELLPLVIGEANLKAGSEYTVFIGAKRYEALQAVRSNAGRPD